MEFLFALYLFSGALKYFMDFWKIDFKIDITLATGVLAVFSAFVWFVKEKRRFPPETLAWVLIFVAFYLWLSATVIFSPSPSYSRVKTVLFATNFIALLVPLLYEKMRHGRFSLIISGMSIAAGILYYILLPHTDALSSEARRQFVGMYLLLGTYNGLVFLLMLSRLNKPPRALALLLMIFSVGILFLTGARGPLLFSFFSLLIFAIIKFRYFGKLLMLRVKVISIFRIIVYGVVVLGVFLVVAIQFSDTIQNQVSRTLYRLSLLADIFATDEEEFRNVGRSIESREMVMRVAFQLITQNFWHFLGGHGVGSFSVLAFGEDGKSHPHNIFLEIGAELGLLGIILFVFFLIWPFLLKKKIGSNPYTLGVIFLFLNAMKSHSLVDLRLFFGLFALMYMWSDRLERVPSKSAWVSMRKTEERL